MQILTEEIKSMGPEAIRKLSARVDSLEVSLADNKVIVHVIPLLEKISLGKPLSEDECSMATLLIDFAYKQLIVAGAKRLAESRNLKKGL